MDRRQFVTSGGTAFAIGLAGCATFGSEAREGVVLTHVELGNASPEPQVFDVLVTYDEEVVHWGAYEVETGDGEGEMGGEVVDVDAPDDHGDVEVYVRVEEQWERTDFDFEEYDGKRVIVTATYGRPEEGVLRLSRLESDRPTSTGE